MAIVDLSAAIEMVAQTDPGQVRTNNEDSVLANVALGLAVLADGMGGYNAGGWPVAWQLPCWGVS